MEPITPILIMANNLFALVYPFLGIGLTVAYWNNIHPITGLLVLVAFGYSGYVYYPHVSGLKNVEEVEIKKIIPPYATIIGVMLLFNPINILQNNISNVNEIKEDIAKGRYQEVLDTTKQTWDWENYKSGELRAEAFRALLAECRQKSGDERSFCVYKSISAGIVGKDLRPLIYEEYGFIKDEDDIFKYTLDYEEKRGIEEASKYDRPFIGMRDYIEYTKLGPAFETEDRMGNKVNTSPRVKSKIEMVWYYSDDQGDKYFFVANILNGEVISVREGKVSDEDAEKMNVPFPRINQVR